MPRPLSRTVETFIRTRVGIAECLRLGLINHKALARLICDSCGDSRVAAAQMAVGRLARRTKSAESNEQKILKELKRARVITRSNMMAVILKAPQSLSQIAELQKELLAKDDELTVIHGLKNVTLILGQEHRASVKKLFQKSAPEFLSDLVKIQILVSERAIRMPGFSAFLYAQLGAHGVNLLQELTCSGEFLLLVEDKDLERALRVLRPNSQGSATQGKALR